MNIRLDTILLFALLVPFIMANRISPQETPYWLFGLIFLGLLSNIVLDIIKIQKPLYNRLKQGLLWCLIAASIGAGFLSAIIVRHRVAPTYMIHDIVLQQEASIRFFLDGKNPYNTSYFGTQLESWHYSDTEINPALYYFVMEPFYLLFTLPFYYGIVHTFGFFDGRIPLFFLFFTTLIFASKLVVENEKKLLFVILLAFNPAMLAYTLEGRSDMFVFAFLFVGLYFLYRKKYLFSAVLLALSFAIKQSVWPLFPLYLFYLYFKTRSLKKTATILIPFFVTFISIVAPFFIWNQKAFIESTLLYVSGGIAHGYPISGYGIGAFLQSIDIIKNKNDYYPFIIWQIAICLPLLFLLFKFLKKHVSVKALIICYGIFLFVFWYFSRYFNNSHVGYLTMVFIAGYFWPEATDEGEKK